MPAIHDIPNSGQYFLMVAGAFAVWAGNSLRTVPECIKTLFFRKFTVQLYLTNSEPVYDWVSEWMQDHEYSRRASSVSISSKLKSSVENKFYGIEEIEKKVEISFVPAPGSHFFWYKKRPIWFSRIIEKQEFFNAQVISRPRETIKITVLGYNQEILRSLIDEIVEVRLSKRKKSEKVSTLISSTDFWREYSGTRKRLAGSVFLKKGIFEEIISDVKKFCGSTEWYYQTGVPYRRGYLLHGRPGSGKSSAVLAIASELEMPIHILDLTDAGMNDSALIKLIQSTTENSIVLIEDIDAIFAKREKTDGKLSRVTFSGLLNALDGIMAGEGRLLFMTTNHKENLDPALIRPGRVDREFFIDLPDIDQIKRLVKAFRCDEEIKEEVLEDYASHCIAEKMSMAEVSGRLLINRHLPLEKWKEFDSNKKC